MMIFSKADRDSSVALRVSQVLQVMTFFIMGFLLVFWFCPDNEGQSRNVAFYFSIFRSFFRLRDSRERTVPAGRFSIWLISSPV